MDAHIDEEEIDADPNEGNWSFTSKALLFSNALVSLLIVLVLSFTIIGGGSAINAESGDDVDAQANLEGEFNTEKPGSPNNDKDVLDSDSDLDPSVMSIANGCLTQKIKDEDDLDGDGIQDNSCSKTFVRDDIIDYCDGLERELKNLDDRCYVMSALMNTNVGYCDYIEDPGLSKGCFESFEA